MMKNLLTITLLLLASIAFGQIDSVGIIGSATPTGWDSDTKMTQDAANPDLWTISMPLTTGACKFRANSDWVINWGDVTFPTGIGTQGGADINVQGGTMPFDITFNSATGEYTFVSNDTTFAPVGIIGDATPGGWDDDTDMIQDPNIPWFYTLEIELVAGECKFRADDDWAINWGDAAFPSGVATAGGANIASVPGNYLVSLNTATGEYNFETLIPVYEFVSIIGEGAPTGDWGVDDHLVQSAADPTMWSLQATFNGGEAKIRADTAWDVNWGNSGFPMDTAFQDGPNIPVVAGDYLLEFNSTTGVYNFRDPITNYASVGIIGSGAPSGWDNDMDMIQNPNQPDEWKITVVLVAGELKFRAEDDWAVNWGDTGFPTGTGVQDGANIAVFDGTWEIAFNSTTGEYSFTPVSVGSIGPASPTAGWDNDEDMTHDPVAANLWRGQQELTAGEFKFRKDDDWAVNWGGVEFPMDALATQDGPNINIPTAGAYDISLLVTQNHSPVSGDITGEYSFVEVLSTDNPFTVHNVKIIPNPATDMVNVKIEDAELEGKVSVVIMDFTGKLMHRAEYDSVNNLTFDVSNYPTGNYMIQLTGDNFIIGKQMAVAR